MIFSQTLCIRIWSLLLFLLLSLSLLLLRSEITDAYRSWCWTVTFKFSSDVCTRYVNLIFIRYIHMYMYIKDALGGKRRETQWAKRKQGKWWHRWGIYATSVWVIAHSSLSCTLWHFSGSLCRQYSTFSPYTCAFHYILLYVYPTTR